MSNSNLSKEEAITRSKYLVEYCARHYVKQSYYADLIQEGYLGVLLHYDRFDPSSGVKFETFIGWWIRAYILSFLKKINLVKIPKSMRNKLRELKRANQEEQYTQLFNLISQIKNITSLDLEDKGCPLPLNRCNSLTPEIFFLKKEAISVLESVFSDLSEEQQEILTRRYLNSDTETLQAIGDQKGKTKERIRQIEVQGIDKLKKGVVKLKIEVDALF